MVSKNFQQIFVVLFLLILKTIETIDQQQHTTFPKTFRNLPRQQIRPENSNIYSFVPLKYDYTKEKPENLKYLTYRDDREPKGTSSLSTIRKRLNEEKLSKKVDLEILPKVENNYTEAPPETYYRDIKSERYHNRENDKLRLIYSYKNSERPFLYVSPVTECNFELICTWQWKATDGSGIFFVANAENYDTTKIGPPSDADNNPSGHFLMLNSTSTSKELQVISTLFSPSVDTCKMEVWIYQEKMTNCTIHICVETANQTKSVISEIKGDNSQTWLKYTTTIGNISQDFNVIMEVIPNTELPKSAVVAIDNIKMTNCFAKDDPINFCTQHQYRCTQTNACINNSEICDIFEDCDYGDDEHQNCDKIPYGARCNFEQDWCGWQNVGTRVLRWARHNGSTPTNRTGPSFDHTYMNNTGKYMYVNMEMGRDVGFASMATLQSVIFNPPPSVHGNSSSKYYNSCMIRFYLHQYGSHKSGLMLQLTELRPNENTSNELMWSYNDYGDTWVRKIVILPNVTNRYFLHFDARRGIRYIGDVAIDDFSMSPECFGLNIPKSELGHYSYWNPINGLTFNNKPFKDFINKKYYKITTCGAKGREGPVQQNCTRAYFNTTVKVEIMRAPGLNGVQKWIVPAAGFYTLILVGASGGKGSSFMGSSRGAQVRVVVELYKGQELFMLVGQEGTNACHKTLGFERYSSCRARRNEDSYLLTGVRGVLRMEVYDGGGGGGGATAVFFYNRTKHLVPLAVAGGGGGLGIGRFIDTGMQHGQAINMSRPPYTGKLLGAKTSGSGGGWQMFPGLVTYPFEGLVGQPLLKGSTGGRACYDSVDGRGEGGFGGGGGGCILGGGGGGYSGGNSWLENTTNGEGGYSYLDPMRTIPDLSEAIAGYHVGPGSITIIPAIVGCGCDFKCVALDAYRSQVTCICTKDNKILVNASSCMIPGTPDEFSDWLLVVLTFLLVSLVIAFASVCVLLYHRYQHRSIGILRRKMISNADLQLNRLPITSNNMLTEYNPNYEFAGVTYTLKDLKDIPRDQLQLQKALGQGAFGEVYQGFYRQRSGDAVELPVAVKTLPALSAQEAEVDFLMEALIMSKFNHPNIVHFIGVCFDKHPRFIVLELLAGGDLKNFLRESRPKPDKNSPLTMKDLVMVAIDVAKGCSYLEENRFIHRDIAARNCLLTTKGPGRVVKIADFGMSRDIYRSDYYRKGGRAMLPIKWMPPEAFLDGIFTSKTDIWSFGVLLWEIFSMGYMPYTGCANRQVMQLVTSGGRLEPPANCPGPLYGIMTQCWHPDPEERPNFKLILERLGYCAQDPEVINSPLPIFNRPPSQEQDATIMRPGKYDQCLAVSKASADYLIPTDSTTTTCPTTIGSTSSVEKLLPENSEGWETSFVIPHSKSTQPLLMEHDQSQEGLIIQDDKLLTPDISKTDKISPVSLPNNILSNQVNKIKSEVNSLRAGVSLDAGALAKQNMSYANINPDELKLANGVLLNGPCSLTKDNTFLPRNASNGTLINESINC